LYTLADGGAGSRLNKILLSEPIEEAGLKVLEGKAQVIISPDPSSHSVGKLLVQADGLILRTATQVDAAMIQAAPRLKVISRTGGGLNNVDLQAATSCKVVVCGVKGPQDRYVAEHAVALMGALAKQLPYLDAQIRGGNFRSRFEYRPMGLQGKTVGLVGLGRIGRIVAQICSRGFGMQVWAYDPFVDPGSLDEGLVRLTGDLGELIRGADFLSLHVPATEKTIGLMGREQFGLMKSTAFLINTSRGEIVQQQALIEALREGRIAGAGLDVLEREPPEQDNPLLGMPNVILTPHTAALTKDAVAKLAEGAALNALAVLEGRPPSYSANWEQLKDSIGKR
jgi:D-3-phosphoglycerate dehydrogenase